MSSFQVERRKVRRLLQDQAGHPLCGPLEMNQQLEDSIRWVAEEVGLPDVVQGTPVTLTLHENEYTLTGSYRDRIRRVTVVSTGIDLRFADEELYRSLHDGNPPPRGMPSRWSIQKRMDEDETDAVWKLLVTPEPGASEVGQTLDVTYNLMPSVFSDSHAVPLDDGLCQVVRYHAALTIAKGWRPEQRAERQLGDAKLEEWAAYIEPGIVRGYVRRRQGQLQRCVEDVMY